MVTRNSNDIWNWALHAIICLDTPFGDFYFSPYRMKNKGYKSHLEAFFCLQVSEGRSSPSHISFKLLFHPHVSFFNSLVPPPPLLKILMITLDSCKKTQHNLPKQGQLISSLNSPLHYNITFHRFGEIVHRHFEGAIILSSTAILVSGLVVVWYNKFPYS